MKTGYHIIRTADGRERVKLTPMRAIRLRCLDCCCWSQKAVRECPCKDCPLWPYRMGKGNPKFVEVKDGKDKTE